MNPHDYPSSNASGAAAARQPEKSIPEPDQEQPADDERAARVAQLRDEYQRGTYHVNAAELSSDIVSKHLKGELAPG